MRLIAGKPPAKSSGEEGVTRSLLSDNRFALQLESCSIFGREGIETPVFECSCPEPLLSNRDWKKCRIRYGYHSYFSLFSCVKCCIAASHDMERYIMKMNKTATD